MVICKIFIFNDDVVFKKDVGMFHKRQIVSCRVSFVAIPLFFAPLPCSLFLKQGAFH